MGGQALEKWPRQLFVDSDRALEALDFFLETGNQTERCTGSELTHFLARSSGKHGRVARRGKGSSDHDHGPAWLRPGMASARPAQATLTLRMGQLPGRRDMGSGRTIAHMAYTRITTEPGQMGGVPCLRGLRIPVATIVALVAEGETTESILALYPDLEADDVREALLFAAEAVRERTLPLAAGE